jgi:hypothetical protein
MAELPKDVDVRAAIMRALEADLVGPFYPPGYPGAPEEVLKLPPSRWYLTGFLAPERAREEADPTAADELDAVVDDDEDQTGAEPQPKQPPRLPASIGLSVLLPPGGSSEGVTVTVRFAEYVPETLKDQEGSRGKTVWRRVPRSPAAMQIPLDPESVALGQMVDGSPGIWVKGSLAAAEAPGLPPGVRALALFVVNQRQVEADRRGPRDPEFMFQVEMEVAYAPGFVARPNRQGETAADWDDKVADLQYRNHAEHAVGHGVSAIVSEKNEAGRATRVRTCWLPSHEVARVRTHEDADVLTSMEKLAALETGTDAARELRALVDHYGEWLAQQAAVQVDSPEREDTKKELLHRAERARQRISAGIARLERDPQVFLAFKLTNEAMAESALRRSAHRYSDTERPSWRMFQLAFVLLNVVGIADEANEDERNAVELIFFPTGGGKTEAYLGVIAFTLVLRRLRGQARPDRGLGVAVLLRYTLRLLTLDQLGRAATLVCALESLRQRDPARLGAERFAVGLWVGKSATANTLAELKKQVIDYKNSASPTAMSPFPLTNCPWCGHALGKDSLNLVPSASKTEGIVVGCTRFTCEFSARKNPQGLPVLFVDEQVYRELPAFLVATVDKFAMLPWRGETGMLFGRATAHDGARFFGPLDALPRGSGPKNARPLAGGLLPPELIVQDELHLISGPLGTMVGLYETAIEHLSTRRWPDGKTVRPKVLASTATVRRANEQIRALFARRDTAVFPPPGVDETETWFSTKKPKPGTPPAPGRLYFGVAAPGRAMKGILLRAYVTLLSAAQREYVDIGRRAPEDLEPGKHPADPYMTLVGYFNSLRELGGMRRLVEDEVHLRTQQIEDRVPVDHRGPHPTLKNRLVQVEPVELTSREPTARIKEAKDRLDHPHAAKDHVDVLLASNMISVGVDIDRLGLMVVAGQPKTTAEYIQASSRVGRSAAGLVVTCFNIAKPRDRSHYERFSAYHESFYRFVEATSLTPFSGPALERGLAATLVSMARLADPALTPPGAAMDIERHRASIAAAALEALAARAGAHDELSAEDHARLVAGVEGRAEHLLDTWETLVKQAREEGAARRSYSRFDKDKTAGRPILSMVVDEELGDRSADEQEFVAPTSMRDVEESVHLWLQRRQLGGGGA